MTAPLLDISGLHYRYPGARSDALADLDLTVREGEFVAVVGVSDLVVVETPDALLITTRQQAQDVGKVVKYLDEKKLVKLV